MVFSMLIADFTDLFHRLYLKFLFYIVSNNYLDYLQQILYSIFYFKCVLSGHMDDRLSTALNLKDSLIL